MISGHAFLLLIALQQATSEDVTVVQGPRGQEAARKVASDDFLQVARLAEALKLASANEIATNQSQANAGEGPAVQSLMETAQGHGAQVEQEHEGASEAAYDQFQHFSGPRVMTVAGDLVIEPNNRCAYLALDSVFTGDGTRCSTAHAVSCEPQFSAQRNEKDPWSVPMYLPEEWYDNGFVKVFDCAQQALQAELTPDFIGRIPTHGQRFDGNVTWKCDSGTWKIEKACERANYCRASTGNLTVSPGRDEPQMKVTIEVPELAAYEVRALSCSKCTTDEPGGNHLKCDGTVWVRCDGKHIREVDNTCHTQGSSSSSIRRTEK